MSLNWKEINQVLHESMLCNMTVADIVQPDFEQLLLVLARNSVHDIPSNKHARGGTHTTEDAGHTRAPKEGGHTDNVCGHTDNVCGHTDNVLRISHQAHCCVIHLSAMRIPKVRPAPRFMQLLRARIKGGTITQALQYNDQRIVRLSIIKNNTPFYLWIRLWSASANTFLTDHNDTIIDCYYRRPQKEEVSGVLFASLLRTFLHEGRAISEPYPCTLREHTDTSYNRMIDARYRIAHDHKEKKELTAQLTHTIKKKITRLKKRASTLSNTHARTAEKCHAIARLLQQNAHTIPANKKHITLIDPATAQEYTATLNPQLSIQQNAQLYFAQYKKNKEKSAQQLHNRTRTDAERASLEAIMAKISTMTIEQLRDTISTLSGKKNRTPTVSAGRTAPGMCFYSHGFVILAGKSAKDSDNLMRTAVKGNDIWLHVRNSRGSSIFIRHRTAKSVPLAVLYDAATLAHYFSKARHNTHIDVLYTHVKHLRRLRDAPQGTFTPFHDHGLTLSLDRERLRRLLSSGSDAP